MPKTSKITFNVNDLQRQHTGQQRCYDSVGLARLVNSPTIQERVKKGDLVGYYGHWPRKKFGMQPQEGGMDGGKPITLKPAIRTTFLEADNKGNVTHQTEFLDTQEGRDAYDLYQNKVGGFSAAMTCAPKGFTEVPVRFYGFDYVLEPNFSGNRGYTLAFDSANADPMVCERFDSIDGDFDELNLIHVFDSVEEELSYQAHVYGDLYRKLQDDYRNVLDSVGELQSVKTSLAHENTELLSIISRLEAGRGRGHSNGQHASSSRKPLFIDEAKLLRFDSANDFIERPLASLQRLEDDEKVDEEISKSRKLVNLFRRGR